MDDIVYQRHLQADLRRGLQDTHKLLLAGYNHEAIYKLEEWEDDWTEVLRDPEDPADDGIPLAYRRYAGALRCEFYWGIEDLKHMVAVVAGDALRDLPLLPKEDDYDTHDWAVIQYLRAAQSMERFELPVDLWRPYQSKNLRRPWENQKTAKDEPFLGESPNSSMEEEIVHRQPEELALKSVEQGPTPGMERGCELSIETRTSPIPPVHISPDLIPVEASPLPILMETDLAPLDPAAQNPAQFTRTSRLHPSLSPIQTSFSNHADTIPAIESPTFTRIFQSHSMRQSPTSSHSRRSTPKRRQTSIPPSDEERKVVKKQRRGNEKAKKQRRGNRIARKRRRGNDRQGAA